MNCSSVISEPFVIITGKRPWCSEVGSVNTRQRKVISVEVKMDVFGRDERDDRTADMKVK